MLRELRPAIVLLVLLTAATGLAYPLAMTWVAQTLLPWQAGGSVVERDGKPVGSLLIGQNITKPDYFHPRPSATTDTDPNDSTKTVPAPYNAMNSSGSNLAPTAKALADRVAADLKTLQEENAAMPVPADLLTTSASGLDPDISPQAALFQVPRIAKARNLPEEKLRALVESQVQGRFLGLFGEPHVNVLSLNLELDRLH